MKYEQAKAFVDKIVGWEHDGDDSKRISPVPCAFLEGAIGAENVPPYCDTRYKEKLIAVGKFLSAVGQALVEQAQHGN